MFKEAILKRKSVRSFSDKRFSDELKSEIANDIKNLTPLYDDAVTNFKFCTAKLIKNDISGKLVSAPYYIIISARPEDGFLENAGFMAQQLVLILTLKGIGTCYCGMGKPRKDFSVKGEYCITLALGFPAEKEKWRDDISEFKRKPLEKFLIGDSENDFLEPFAQAARLAPSAVNMQPVLLEMNGSSIDVYRKKPPLSRFDNLQRIDVGIAIAHIFMYARDRACHIDFFKKGVSGTKKYIYFISLNVLEELANE